MTTMEPRQVAVKVSPEGDRLISSGAHYLRMSKKDLVEAAVEFYLNARREEMQAGIRELLSQFTFRPRDQVARFFAGTDLIEPGLVLVEEWRPEPGTVPEGKSAMWGAVGRKR